MPENNTTERGQFEILKLETVGISNSFPDP